MITIEKRAVFRMALQLGILALLVSTCGSQDHTPSSSDRVPVLVELFTSEGCDSCPPADRFLQTLDTQPLPGIEIVVLSEHVDYWNHLGWKDPFSSSEFSDRQRVYGRQFKLEDVYTPQIVIDGSRQILGSDVGGARTALQEARKQPKIPLQITSVLADRGRLRFHIEGLPFNTSKDLRSLELYAVAALNRAKNHVTAGENAQRDLTHTAVVRSLTRLAKLRPGEQVSRDVELRIDQNVESSNLRVIVFLQDPDSRKVVAAAMKLAEPVGSATRPSAAPAQSHP